MPIITRQTPNHKVTPVAPLLRGGDILDGCIPIEQLATSKITTVVYGQNGVGKTTWCCQKRDASERILLIAIDPAPTGGARSAKHIQGVSFNQVAARYLEVKDPVTGVVTRETIKGSEKVLAIADSIRKRCAAGNKPFDKVVVDGLTSWNEIILSEVMQTDYEDMPAVLGKGKVTTDQYVQRSETLIRYMRPLIDLPCDVFFIAQERDHNPPKDDKGRALGSKLMREAHPSSHDGSWFTLALGDEQARWIQNACDFVLQLYNGDELVETTSPPIQIGNQTIPGTTQLTATGKHVKRLRCSYHPNYAARFREDYRNVPEYIEAPDPAHAYAAFLDVVAGKRTKWGKYND